MNTGRLKERQSEGRGERRVRRQSKEETRQELLSTAHQMLLDDGLPAGINLKLTDVLKRKGLTTGAAYHIWDSQRQFQEDLTMYIAEKWEFARAITATEAKTHEAAVEEIAARAGESIEEITRAHAERYLEAFRHHREFYIALQLWGIQSPSKRVTRAIKNGYDEIHNEFVEVFEGALATAGLRVKAPYTINDATVAVTALTEGLTLRQRFDQSKLWTEAGHYLYAEAIVALLRFFTEDDPEAAT